MTRIPDTFNAAFVEDMRLRLESLTEAAVSRQPAPEVWSAKQVLGHLVDSAANNHARWARMAGEDDLTFPTWDQDAWMTVQDWQGREWVEILPLWHAYNLHLARFASLLTPEALDRRARIGTLNGGEPMMLEALLAHYERHMRHHLAQIWERAEA
ncbi:DinB family protein [Deinococcus sp.]|uniref:DinB family protein n=1 Tax=Deinococcus sp. TaxID=47478 RepID=UPI003B5ACE4A